VGERGGIRVGGGEGRGRTHRRRGPGASRPACSPRRCCTRARAHTHTHTHERTHTHAHTHTHARAHTHTHIDTHTRTPSFDADRVKGGIFCVGDASKAVNSQAAGQPFHSDIEPGKYTLTHPHKRARTHTHTLYDDVTAPAPAGGGADPLRHRAGLHQGGDDKLPGALPCVGVSRTDVAAW
jgi:hypothetical protein